jgi:hypothetical protein
MPRLLQKGASKNFDFHVTLQHRQSYKLTAKYIFSLTIYNTSELTELLYYIKYKPCDPIY